jgi:hypothetical protein
MDDDDVSEVTQIFNDCSVDSLLFSCDSESEGGILDNTNNDDVTFACEVGYQNVILPEDKGIRVPVVGFPVVCRNKGVNHSQTMFLTQILLLRELDINVEKQNSILQPSGNVVLMANLNAFY